MNYATVIANRLNVNQRQVEKTIELLEQGATVPFIARYRKEATGGLNEVQIAAIRDLLLRLKELDKRREAILASIEEQGKLTPELRQQIEATESMTDLEDLYLPYRPKRRTRATIAIEKGYEPLADAIMSGKWKNESGKTTEEDLQYARDIIAERISEDAVVRNRVRNVFRRKAMLTSTLARGVDENDEKVGKFESWIDWKEPISKAPSHRILALFRGEDAGVLKVHVRPDDDEDCIAACSGLSGKAGISRDSAEQLQLAIADSYKRLIMPSIETEFRNLLKEKADREAIRVFAENLRQLLLAAPMGQKRTLAIDPGFRTGCKVVCLDAQGQLLHNETIYPFTSVREERAAINKLEALVEAFQIEAIAIGNGTAGRETEEVVQRCHFNRKVIAVSVSEAGASVYSASDVARREFPDYDDFQMDVTVLLDTLQAEAPALTKQQQDTLYNNIMEGYAGDPTLRSKQDKLKALRQDPYYNALQIKYAYAVTCHKAQGGQWTNVFIDQGYMTEELLSPDYFRWLYTALTRATQRIFFVNWPKEQSM